MLFRSLDDVETAASIVQEAANPNANIIFGSAFDDSLQDEMRVTVIATGFDETKTETNQGVFTTSVEKKSAPVEDDTDIDAIFKIFNKR